MKLAITGGTGLVGRFFVEDALAGGDTPVLLGRHAPPAGYFTRPVAHQPFALGDRPRLSGVDLLIHCAFSHVAGRYRGGEGDDPHGFATRNLDGTVALFEAARAAGVPRVVFLSTRAVYGSYRDGTTLHEGLAPRPTTLYGEVKRLAEKALADLSGPDFTGISLRATGVYGPAGPGRYHKWSDLFADFRAGRPIAPRQGTEVHGADLACAARLLRDAPPGPCNVSDFLLDRHDLLRMVASAEAIDHPPPPRVDAPFSHMSIARLAALGWQPGGAARLADELPRLLAQS